MRIVEENIFCYEEKKDIYHKLFIAAAVFCLVILGLACDKKEDKSENKEMIEEIAIKKRLLFSKPDQEIVGLLSVKYNQDLNIIEKIVDQYLTDTDFSYRLFKKSIETNQKKVGKQVEDEVGFRTEGDFKISLGALDKSEYTDLVGKISLQFSLDPSIIASILIDYKIWNAAHEAAEFVSGDD